MLICSKCVSQDKKYKKISEGLAAMQKLLHKLGQMNLNLLV